MEVTESWNGLGWDELKEESTTSLSNWMLPKSKMSRDYYMDFFLVLSFWTRSKERRTRQSGEKIEELKLVKNPQMTICLFSYLSWFSAHPENVLTFPAPAMCFLFTHPSADAPLLRKGISAPKTCSRKGFFPKATSALHLLLTAALHCQTLGFFIICLEKKKKCDLIKSVIFLQVFSLNN